MPAELWLLQAFLSWLRFSGGPAQPAPVYSTSGMRQGATLALGLSQYFFL